MILIAFVPTSIFLLSQSVNSLQRQNEKCCLKCYICYHNGSVAVVLTIINVASTVQCTFVTNTKIVVSTVKHSFVANEEIVASTVQCTFVANEEIDASTV